MQFIDKKDPAGEKCVQEYIDGKWDSEINAYISLSYDKELIQSLRPVLVKEQDYYCCYCMRKLYDHDAGKHQENVTLEHIIPNKITSGDWKRDKSGYLRYGNLSTKNVNVCCGGKLTSNQKTVKITCLPHPHFVAYHNIVASCDGRIFEKGNVQKSKCCNNKRGNKFVPPIYFDINMVKGIGYDSEGKLDFDDTKYESTWFQRLNLTCSWLTKIRKIWCDISKTSYTIQDIDDAINDTRKRQDIIDDINIDPSWENNDSCWILLSEYCWFYDYYKSKP